ncbi:cell division protein FtsK [Thiorhodococcus mannitoliphagus]|uniref:DNA translocase FtsK n=1 Tax=Thiorhodococcus mannitoliphagus TaxID=329406 RepID=A0A6P1DVF9_9GAMM|nr:DNA translocase FtsK [Thiorhodococcus mannitoliphagus]NEX20052.1 cell division protein FtsK [Thiorhodococcus mannitoliphagus]
MAQATRFGQLTFSDHVERALREGSMWTLMCVAIYLALSLVSYSPQDPGWSYVGEANQVSNAGGRTGAWFADIALYLFGFFAYLIPFMVAWSAWLVFRGAGEDAGVKTWLLSLRWIGFLITVAAGCAFASIHFAVAGDYLPNGAGGGLGLLISSHMLTAFNPTGANLFLVGGLAVSLTLFFGISWVKLMDAIGAAVLQATTSVWHAMARAVGGLSSTQVRKRSEKEAYPHGLPKALKLVDPAAAQLPNGAPDAEPQRRRKAPKRPLTKLPQGVQDAMADPAPAAPEPESAVDLPRTTPGLMKNAGAALREMADGLRDVLPKGAREAQGTALQPKRPEPSRPPASRPSGAVPRPPLDLLDAPRKSGRGYSQEKLEELSRQVETNLADFGVQVEVVAVYPGPVVTLFELRLAPGIKASKITGLARDLARALTTVSVRVVEIIPGKSVIGIEIPNKQRETVFLREIFDSPAYQDASSPLTIGLGTNISGLPVVSDLARMPHALIAGTTGSGKSVAINAIILSLLYKAGPEDVRLIMVDPKMLELSVYEGIPHLLTPVVTDMKEAANALRWCVGEMERRYRLMAKMGVRNIAGYNRKVAEAEAAGTPIPDPTVSPEDMMALGGEVPTLVHLPYVVVIIDELADMMMVVGKKVEELIARLAQKARASGIHLLLATQRPSVDVLTGLIKANIPTRMAFQVSSRIDSRTVLDQMGAEQLLGHGDMLYLPPTANIPQRVHGAFVDDPEVHRVVEFLKSQYGEADYIHDVLREPTETLPGIDPEPRGDTEDSDPLFDEAVQFVIESRRASISGVQRKLKIGYNRAARMVEEMERIGVVGPAETNGNREVLAPPPMED